MSNNPQRSIQRAGGVFQGLSRQIKLILRLMGDKRVSPVLKLMPIGALVYMIWPIDLMPGIPVDDAAVVWLGSYLFIELCPPEVVQEHMDALRRTPPLDWENNPPRSEGDVVDAEYRDVTKG